MKHNFSFESENLIFSPLEEKHIEDLRQLRNRSENRVWFFDSAEITKEAQKAWFASQQEKVGDYMFAVFSRENPEEFLGTVAIYRFDSIKNSYEVGRLLLDNQKTAKKGLGAELVDAACRVGFDLLGAGELHAEVFADNGRSARCFTLNGFDVAGEKELFNRKIILFTRKAENFRR